jgi:hypothetical protein
MSTVVAENRFLQRDAVLKALHARAQNERVVSTLTSNVHLLASGAIHANSSSKNDLHVAGIVSYVSLIHGIDSVPLYLRFDGDMQMFDNDSIHLSRIHIQVSQMPFVKHSQLRSLCLSNPIYIESIRIQITYHVFLIDVIPIELPSFFQWCCLPTSELGRRAYKVKSTVRMDPSPHPPVASWNIPPAYVPIEEGTKKRTFLQSLMQTLNVFRSAPTQDSLPTAHSSNAQVGTNAPLHESPQVTPFESTAKKQYVGSLFQSPIKTIGVQLMKESVSGMQTPVAHKTLSAAAPPLNLIANFKRIQRR